MPIGPYDMWPREDAQYTNFAVAIEYIVNELHAKVILFSHTNGFKLPPNFRLINGRDYPILQQLKQVVLDRGIIKKPQNIILLNAPMLPNMTKSFIGRMDMVVTGRVHASVAAISQLVPTVFVSYEKSFIPSSKMYGFAELAGVKDLVCEPGNVDEMIEKIAFCYQEMENVHKKLEFRIPQVKILAKEAFDAMKELVG